MTVENKQAKSPTVAYLGPEATFTHQAALRWFGNQIAALSKDTIAEIFEAVDTAEADYGVVPVENSTEGAVTVTFDLFGDTELQIGAEIYLQIHHSPDPAQADGTSHHLQPSAGLWPVPPLAAAEPGPLRVGGNLQHHRRGRPRRRR